MRRGTRVAIAVGLTLATAAWVGVSDARAQQVLRDLGPDKTLGVCAFGLWGADAAKMQRAALGGAFGGIVGAIIASTGKAAHEDSPYSLEVMRDFRTIFEQAFAATGAFQVRPSERLVVGKDGKPLALGDAARANALFACVKAQSSLAATFGFQKKVRLTTLWQLAGASGWEVPIKTEVDSEDTQGMKPDTADPAMKPLLLQLARRTAAQFLEKLNALLVKAGSATRIAVGDPEEVPVAALVDPGTYPQPEPDCALNADGKWEKHVTLPGGADLALVYIPEGSFFMGSAEGIDNQESQPQDRVTIPRAFWLAKFELTQAQWTALMSANPSKAKGGDLPVDSVTWNDSRKFLDALNRHLGLAAQQAFRLPSEAEWEYASRAGTTTNYSFSNSAKDLGRYAWFDKSSSGIVHPVGRLRPNPWGLYDMYGNVSEWCEDTWQDDYEGGPVDGTAWRSDGPNRVHRGGHFSQAALKLRSYARKGENAAKGAKTIGLRLAVPALRPQSGRPTAPVVAGTTRDETAAATPVDPGTLPQPEPDCTLNADREWEKHVTLASGVDLVLVYVPGGGFLMGSTRVEDPPSQPQHKVTVDRPFWIGKYELTQAQWKSIIDTNPSRFKGDNLPVESVTGDDARRFLEALNKRLGLGGEQALRLPTEAEWEYASRAGTTTDYSFSNSSRTLGQYAWYGRSASGTTHPVGQRRPNPWGLYDMHGNVSEWCEDGWHEDYQGAPADGTAWRTEDSDRVHRGGHWDESAADLRSYCRSGEDAASCAETLGFRVVMPARSPGGGGGAGTLGLRPTAPPRR